MDTPHSYKTRCHPETYCAYRTYKEIFWLSIGFLIYIKKSIRQSSLLQVHFHTVEDCLYLNKLICWCKLVLVWKNLFSTKNDPTDQIWCWLPHIKTLNWSSKSCQRWHHQCVSSLRGHELESIKIHVQFSLQCRVFSSMFIHSCCTFAACSVCFIWGFTSETGSEVFRCHQVWLSECHIQFQSLVGSAQTELTSCHPARKTCWSRHLC